MAQVRKRKNKKNPHYQFLVSWEPKHTNPAYVKRETSENTKTVLNTFKVNKKADYWAQAETLVNVKKDILRSLSIISLILILELMIYLAWIRFVK